MFRVIEFLKTKDGTNIDRVRRYDRLDGKHSAKAELWNCLYECTNDDNLEYAQCTIMDDNGAVHKTDEYKAVVVEPEVVVEPTEE